jgi:hypothetical protein
MTRSEVDAVLERVRSWPEEEQEEAALLLLALEERRKGVYELSVEEIADLEEALAEMERGEVASDEEVRAVFDHYRQR